MFFTWTEGITFFLLKRSDSDVSAGIMAPRTFTPLVVIVTLRYRLAGVTVVWIIWTDPVFLLQNYSTSTQRQQQYQG